MGFYKDMTSENLKQKLPRWNPENNSFNIGPSGKGGNFGVFEINHLNHGRKRPKGEIRYTNYMCSDSSYGDYDTKTTQSDESTGSSAYRRLKSLPISETKFSTTYKSPDPTISGIAPL